MKKLSFAFFIPFLLLQPLQAEEKELPYSRPDEVSALTSHSDTRIANILSPLTGHPQLQCTDLIAQGAQPIVIRRSYLSPFVPCSFDSNADWDEFYLYKQMLNRYQGWIFLPHQKLQLFTELTKNAKRKIRFTTPTGASLEFLLGKQGVTLASDPYGISNLGPKGPHGRYDLRNTQMHVSPNLNYVEVRTPDGTTYQYRKEHSQNFFADYHLEREILPNGKHLCYSYANNHLTKIESKNPEETCTYASVEIENKETEKQITSHSGQKAKYFYEKRHKAFDIKSSKRKLKATLPSLYLLEKVHSPFYPEEKTDHGPRFLIGEFSGKSSLFRCIYGGTQRKKEPPHYRACSLFLPVGEKGSWKQSHALTYTPALPGKKEGSTNVLHSDGTETHYAIGNNLLIEAVWDCDSKGKWQKTTLFTWDANQRLSSKKIQGKEGTIQAQYYTYDSFGNPTAEILKGDLKGDDTQTIHRIYRTFSQEGRNLLLEETDGPLTKAYTYIPETNLPTTIFTKHKEQILKRTFYSYDTSLNLIETIEDDGCSESKGDLTQVSERLITRYHLRQEQPHLHCPEWKEELCLSEGNELLLKKTRYTYDVHGYVIQEEVFDANEQFAYALHKEYNERGDLLSETDSIENTRYYTYDNKGNCTSKTSSSGRLLTKNSYDARGRLIQIEEIPEEGPSRVTSHTYDAQDHLIETTDPLGQTTRYAYDRITHKVTKEERPPILSLDKEPIPVITYTKYDALGRKITQKDANGHTTRFGYTARGSIKEILHPDGTKESYRYQKTGELSLYIDQEGVRTIYSYDPLGRVIEKSLLSPTEELLAQETYTYNSLHLLSHTDKEGRVTYYSYDVAGRKQTEECAGRITRFSYDSLGRLSTLTEENGAQTRETHYTYDLLDRIIEETKTDLTGTVFYRVGYSYDVDGNQTGTTTFPQNQPTETTCTYDPFGRLVQKRDPVGATTKISYIDTPTEEYTKQVRTQDPQETLTIQNYDAHDRLILEGVESKGTLLRCFTFTYDPLGNLLEKRELLKDQAVRWTYDTQSRIAQLTRGAGTEEEKTTSFTYTKTGRIATKTLPSTDTLHYEYNPLGHLNKLSSSNGEIAHTFMHDKRGRLLSATTPELSLTRKLDPFGNILREESSLGISLEKSYDALGRPLTLDSNNQAKVEYTYDPVYLRKVRRLSPENTLLYVHEYTSFDQAGHVQKEELAENAGTVSHNYDSCGRPASLISKHLPEEYSHDVLGNLTNRKTSDAGQSYEYDALSQLTKEKGNTYSYDSLYNCIEKNGQPHTYNALNELISEGDVQFVYDENGNLIQNRDTRYTYDLLGQLTKAKKPGIEISFTYDPLGRCTSKTVEKEGRRTRKIFLYDEQLEIGSLQEETLREFCVLGYLQKPVAIELSGNTYACLTDDHRNVRRLINRQGIALSYDYSAFGTLESDPQEVHYNPWRFSCKRHDEDLELVYFGKRFYDPTLHRWLTPDPAGCFDSINLYQYLFNNPFRYTDPDGRFVVQFTLWTIGTALALPTATAVATAAVLAVASYAAYEYGPAIVQSVLDDFRVGRAIDNLNNLEQDCYNQLAKEKEKEKRKHNTNPFGGPVDEGVISVDPQGNAIPVGKGNWLTGSEDGTWIQEREPDGTTQGKQTGTRKDGGHSPLSHEDPRAQEPHGHRPETTNEDGTPWLPIY